MSNVGSVPARTSSFLRSFSVQVWSDPVHAPVHSSPGFWAADGSRSIVTVLSSGYANWHGGSEVSSGSDGNAHVVPGGVTVTLPNEPPTTVRETGEKNALRLTSPRIVTVHDGWRGQRKSLQRTKWAPSTSGFALAVTVTCVPVG